MAQLQSVFHPSDFSAASEVAFVHALKVALAARAELSVLHVSADDSLDWRDFPGVRDTLERWGVLPEGSSQSDVVELGLGVRKVMVEGRSPVRASLEYLKRHPTDLIVLAVHQREGRMRWLERATGEPIARAAGEMTLFLPHGVAGFVSREDGSISLKNVLVPIANKPRPQPAVEATARLIRGLGVPAGTVTLLHAGPAGEAPAVNTPDDTGWTWRRQAVAGEPVAVIIEAAKALPADLIVMTTDGRDGFLDALRGSTAERVLREAPCPVASLPAGSMLG